MDRVTKVAVLLLGISLAPAAHAETAYDKSYFALDAVGVMPDDRASDIDSEFSSGGRFGIGFPIGSSVGNSRTALEIDLVANRLEFEGDTSGNQKAFMLDLVHAWDLGDFDPYVNAGLGIIDEEIGPYDAANLAIEVGGGVAYGIFKGAFLRAGLSAMSVHNDDLPTGGDPYIDLRFNVGLVLPLSGEPAPAAPAPARKAVDSDGDGLADAQDKCPSTPASTADGCPAPAPVVQTDADGDGVYDSQDQCAGTLSGLKVDAAGCAVQTEAQSIVLKGVTFLPGSATLTADAKTVLDTAAASLSGDKSLKVELGGHTDAQGKDSANMALSQKRADSARQYLISKGVEADRLTAKGYGETAPIADNNTVEGRAENRRVELKVVK